jgi:hypothetical protein
MEKKTKTSEYALLFLDINIIDIWTNLRFYDQEKLFVIVNVKEIILL